MRIVNQVDIRKLQFINFGVHLLGIILIFFCYDKFLVSLYLPEMPLQSMIIDGESPSCKSRYKL